MNDSPSDAITPDYAGPKIAGRWSECFGLGTRLAYGVFVFLVVASMTPRLIREDFSTESLSFFLVGLLITTLFASALAAVCSFPVYVLSGNLARPTAIVFSFVLLVIGCIAAISQLAG
ncbi:MAG: hypothetical protein AAF086_10250 [Planctomycetota bacterium]